MKIAILAAAVLLSGVAKAEALVLECEGFEHSETVKVRVYRDGDGRSGSFVELDRKGKETKRPLSPAELASGVYKVSPMHGIDRAIKRVETGWVLSYSCGQDRPLSCRETD